MNKFSIYSFGLCACKTCQIYCNGCLFSWKISHSDLQHSWSRSGWLERKMDRWKRKKWYEKIYLLILTFRLVVNCSSGYDVVRFGPVRGRLFKTYEACRKASMFLYFPSDCTGLHKHTGRSAGTRSGSTWVESQRCGKSESAARGLVRLWSLVCTECGGQG